MQFLRVFLEEKPEKFSCSAFRSCVFDEYQSALIPRKLPCPEKLLVMGLHYNDLNDCSTKELIHRFLGRAF